MKKYLHLLIALLILTETNSCKKAENDPALSLRSRKARVVGEWKVDEGVIIGDDHTYTINGNSFQLNKQGYLPLSGTASINFQFEKDGKCQVTIDLSSFFFQYEGYWNFTGGVGDVKNKSQIVIRITSLRDLSGTYKYKGNQHYITYDLLECRNKKMQLKLVEEISEDGSILSKFSESWKLLAK